MKLTEKVLILLIVLALLMKFLNIPGGGVLLSFSGMLLYVLYFFLAFAFLNGIRLRRIFNRSSYQGLSALRVISTIGTGIAMASVWGGILFRFQFWPGASPMLLCGLLMLLVITCIAFFRLNGEPFYRRILIRSCVLIVCGGIMASIPSETLSRIQYRNYPDYLAAREALMKDPENKMLQHKEELEYLRMTLDSADFALFEENMNRLEEQRVLLLAGIDGNEKSGWFEFNEDGSYAFGYVKGITTEYDRGVYELKDTIINLDRTDIGGVTVSLRMVLRSEAIEALQLKTYIYQLDQEGKVIPGAAVFRVAEDNRQPDLSKLLGD